MLAEHEYERGGVVAYIAAWDVHHAKIFGRCESTTGMVPFGCDLSAGLRERWRGESCRSEHRVRDPAGAPHW